MWVTSSEEGLGENVRYKKLFLSEIVTRFNRIDVSQLPNKVTSV